MTLTHFIDISRYQNPKKINWREVGRTQAFVVIKATEGVNFIDRYLNQHVKECRKHNIPFGLYHFARPDRKNGGYKKDAKAEALDFCKQLKEYSDFTVLPVLDLEYEETPLSRSELTEWCEVFASTVKKEVGRDIIVYGNYYYLRDQLSASHNLGRFHLWIAQYNNKDAPDRIPPAWKTWSMWQYTDKWVDHHMYDGPLDANWIKDIDLICR